jgi:hypothetical protein
VAYAFDTKFDTSDLDTMNRRLARCSKEAMKAVRESNKAQAELLAERIRRNTPRTSAKSAARQGKKHKTRPGALAKATRARATGDSASIVGGGRSKGPAPHFYAHEFGGSVLWSSPSTSKRHRIGVAHPAPSISSLGLFDRSGTQRGSAGWFFYPTLRSHEKQYVAAIVDAADKAVRTALARG